MRMRYRQVPQLGGTTSFRDCAIGLRHLLWPTRMVRGDSIRAFERAFAAVVGVHHAISFAAARVGFFGLLGALGIDEGDEVLLPVPTHVVVPNAVRYRGARPVFVDCDPRTCNIDLADAERRITARTRALVVQHTFGVPVDIERAQDLADRHGLALFEDCVHALGATYRGKPVGSFGRAAFFSTEETKVISTVMGGVVVTDDVAIAKYMREFQERCVWPSASLTARYILKLVVYHVLSYPFVHRLGRGLYDLFGRRNPLPRATTPEEARGLRPLRYELRLSNAQAAVGLEQLRRLGRNLAHRRAIADLYVRLLRGRGVLDVISTAHEPAFVRFPCWCAIGNVPPPRHRAPYSGPGSRRCWRRRRTRSSLVTSWGRAPTRKSWRGGW